MKQISINRAISAASRWVILVGAVSCFGCQGLARVFHQSGTNVRPARDARNVILAADFGVQSEATDRSAIQDDRPAQQTRSSESGISRDTNENGAGPPEQVTTEDEPAAQDDDERDRAALPKQTYTAPSAAVRQVALAAGRRSTDGASDSSSLDDRSREAGEAMAGAGTTFVGQPGLSAPQPTVAGVVVSRPGLQEGPASGLGFASPFNILSPQTNPLSGVNGRCADLAGAGFFGGNRPACEMHFRRP